MDRNEALRLLKLNEEARKVFSTNFVHGSTLSKEQKEDFSNEKITWIEDLVSDLIWSSIERKGVGEQVNEVYLELESALDRNYNIEDCMEEELEELQDAVWART